MAKILVVDDEPAVRYTIVADLEEMGHTVHEARDGQHGFEEVQRIRPDIIITDTSMPRVTGPQLIDMIRTLYQTGSYSPRIILTSGNPDPSIVDKVMREGAHGFLKKPYEFEKLTHLVGQALQGIQTPYS